MSRDKLIQKIVRMKTRKGEDYPTITNEELVGHKPRNDIEEYGVDAKAQIVRSEIRDELETVHGFALIPLDNRGTWQRVPIDDAAVSNTRKRLIKMVKSVENAETMILDYQTNPLVSDECYHMLADCKKVVDFALVFTEEALTPKLERLYRRLHKQMQLLTG